MKKLFLGFALFAALFVFNSCEKENATDALTDEALLEEIMLSDQKIDIAPADLPASIQTDIADDYFETYIETVALVENRGYELTLGDEEVLYYRTNGEEINTNDRRRGHPFRFGPCGPGRVIPVDSLPARIVQYVENNYPDAAIRRAKYKNDRLFLLITGPIVLIFDGNEITEVAHCFRPCRAFGERLDPADLSEMIRTYISENYPDAEIKIAFQKRRNGNILVGIITPDGRKIVVFDEDGNFLFERG